LACFMAALIFCFTDSISVFKSSVLLAKVLVRISFAPEFIYSFEIDGITTLTISYYDFDHIYYENNLDITITVM